MKILRNVVATWDRFWFAPQPLLNLALFRIVVCGTMFLMALSRQFDLENFYSDQGLVPSRAALSIMPDFYRPLFPWYFWGDSGMAIAHAILLLGLLLLTFGIGGRLLNLICWICHIGFLQRNYSIAFGADLIGGIFLLLMIGTQSCGRLSLWNWWRKKNVRIESTMPTSVFYRMIQIQLCVVYFYTGLEKLKGATWWDGTALWAVFANSQMVVADLSFMRHLPLVIAFLTFATPVFEVYFTPLVWNPKTRPYMLALGVGFHFGIGVVMALMNFTFIMIAPYVLFLSQDQLRHLLSFVRLDHLVREASVSSS